MNSIINKLLVVVYVIVALSACNELELQESDNNIPVVESYIEPGNYIQVNIKKQLVYVSEDTIPEKLDSLDVTIWTDDNTYLLTNIGEGNYESSSIPFFSGGDYILNFEYNDQIVSGSTIIPSKPENFQTSSTKIIVPDFSGGPGSIEIPEPATLSWSNNNQDYHMIVIENIESNPVLINDNNDRPSKAIRSAPTQGVIQEVNPMQFTYYGTHRIILFKLNPEYAALYEQLGTSSLDITAPPSNIENGLGIFTGINSDTLYIEVISS